MSDFDYYLHEATPERPDMGVRVLRVQRMVDDLNPQVWVHADDFMKVQKERDDLRRTMALLNAVRASQRLPSVVVSLLEDAGFTMRDAKAMVSIVRGALRTINRA